MSIEQIVKDFKIPPMQLAEPQWDDVDKAWQEQREKCLLMLFNFLEKHGNVINFIATE